MAASSLKLGFALLLFHAIAFSYAVASIEPLSASPRRWPGGKVKLALSSSVNTNQNNIIAGTDVLRSLGRAVSLWESVADVRIEIGSSESVSTNSGDTGDGVSLITVEPTIENLALFSKQHSGSTAVTRVFFNARGEITEADIVLNPFYQFSDNATPGTYDLDRVFAHEIGHLLGLEHSIIPTSLMYDEVQKNGISWSWGRALRLSADDTSSIRKLYGGSIDTEDCCSLISGKIIEQIGGNHVFAVDTLTGSVRASAKVDGSGSFDIGGIPPGDYEVWLARTNPLSSDLGDVLIGTARVSYAETQHLTSRTRAQKIGFRLERVGGISGLSRRSVSLERGKINRIFLSGAGLVPEKLKIVTTSRDAKILRIVDVSTNFATQDTVLQLDLELGADASAGDISLVVQNENGIRKHLFGVLTVN